MDRVAVFVDAGYLFAQGSILLAGKKLTRSELVLDHNAAVMALCEFASKVSGVKLLRVYWYDGTSSGPTPQHLALAHLDNLKIRLGFVNSVGEQKGVDSLIVTDIIALARNRAMSDAVLISGDEDLRVGVQQAQEFGVRVHLVGIKPSRGSQSLFLLQEADCTYEWGHSEVSLFLACRPKPNDAAASPPRSPVATAGGTAVRSLKSLAIDVAGRFTRTELLAVVEAFDSTRQLPRDIDRQLLAGGRALHGQDLAPSEKKQIRNWFIEQARSLAAK